MSYWLREIAGWGLVVLGLWVFYWVYLWCQGRWIFEAGILAVVGIFIFRGGVNLLKVTAAARMCRLANEQLYPEGKLVGRR